MKDSSTDKQLGFTPELFPEGSHACCIYNDDAERRSVLQPFVFAGLQAGESVHYWADVIPANPIERALDDRSAATLSKSQMSRLYVDDALATLCPSGEFVVQDVLEQMRQYYEVSRCNGSSGCRLTGEASWLSSEIPGSEDRILFESSINSLPPKTPVTVLCGFDTELFDGETLFELVSVHELMVIHGQVMRNPCYVGPDEYLAARRDPDLLKKLSRGDVLGQLLLVELILIGLPDDLRMAEFSRSALMRIPGVRDTHIVLTTSIIPPDDRWESIRQRCFESAKSPDSLDVSALRSETDAKVFLMRSTSRLFGVVIVEVGNDDAFAPYEDFVLNIANAIAIAQDSWRDRAESRAWSERVANLERRLWRISRELEDVGIKSDSAGTFDPYARPGVDELSQRQMAVLTRLLHGERVSHIADALFLSQSAIRNNLSYIYRKFGVHSQRELLDLFRRPPSE